VKKYYVNLGAAMTDHSGNSDPDDRGRHSLAAVIGESESTVILDRKR